jgi:hypothetical protein
MTGKSEIVALWVQNSFLYDYFVWKLALILDSEFDEPGNCQNAVH